MRLMLVSACCLQATAQAQGIDTGSLRFGGARSAGTVLLPSARVLDPGILEASLAFGHESGVVRATLPTGEVRGGNRAAATAWIDARESLLLQVAGSPLPGVELLAGLPVLLGQGVTAIPQVGGPAAGASALGDLALGARYGVLQPGTGFQWALQAGVRLPTGATEQSFGDGAARLDASTSIAWQSGGPWAVRGYLGYQMGSTFAFGDQVFGDRQLAGAALAYRHGALQYNLDVISTLILAPAATQTRPARASLEVLGGARYLADGFFADLGVGYGALDSHVTPQWRVLASVGVQDLFAGAKAERARIDAQAALARITPEPAPLAPPPAIVEVPEVIVPEPKPDPVVVFRNASLGEFGIWFETGRSTLDPVAQNTLRGIARLLLRSEGSVLVTGRADDQGLPQRNEQLSLERAEAAKAFLVLTGIDASRLHIRAAGQNEPITSQPGVGQSLNRSVTFQWTEAAFAR